ncbi:MAG TPA: penicillin acylase family protein [Pyrinomonadaceae bacterium]|nr:penicillin acylase family protein [Pyrinomonadaceae bacterium]
MTSRIDKKKTTCLFILAAALLAATSRGQVSELWRQVEVIRTEHGVPHIRAQNLKAAGYALAWLQCEDYGTTTPMEILDASGRRALVDGYDRIESDFVIRRYGASSLAKYALLSKDVRDVYEGFAAGVNRYIELHRDQFPKAMPADFTGRDVLATEVVPPPLRKMRAFINRINPPANPQTGPQQPPGNEEGKSDPDEGSNAWAFAPSRTKSGKAILLRNPHLAWTAGYYEAHMTVPGVVDFYGDFRIGGPFTVVGGFNRYLGWSTTNNSPDLDEFYALDVDPKLPDHYLFDGRSVALKRELVTVTYRNGEGTGTETREYWSTPMGPVVTRANGKIYIVKYAGDGEYRAGEQFLKMMSAKSLSAWQNAMRMRARVTSNFTYADGAGNIYFLWNASLPLLPHPVGEDLVAKPAHGAKDIWSRYVQFEQLPQFLNPPGGYVHNENNSPHFTNVTNGVDLKNAYPNFEAPELSLRAQLALQLVSGSEKLSLEDVVRLKHSYRMLLADRVKPDLISAMKAGNPTGDVAAALSLLGKWDNTAAPNSRGSVIFELWWQRYSTRPATERSPQAGDQQGFAVTRFPDEKRFAHVWSADDPFNTPRGLADAARAVEAFAWAVEETKRRYGSLDVTWGDVHRVRRGNVDVGVGGCNNELGCFRTLNFRSEPDGKLAATVGDGWILAVEFDPTPRAYSVLAYGESRLPPSPYFSDQAEMFARGELKKVAFTQADVDAQAVMRFHPGRPNALH